LGINLKVWNRLKSNLLSARVYLKETVLFDLFILLVLYFFIPTSRGHFIHITFIILLAAGSFVFLNFIGKKRNQELDEIKSIINNIRKSVYNISDEIHLSEKLGGLQYEIKKMFEKTKNDIEDMRKLQRMRTEFLGNVSHELRTPIFAIQGYLETLLNGAINDEKVNKHFLGKANTHTTNLNNLLNDLIDISMIESGEMRLSFRYFNINEFLKELVSEQEQIAKAKNIELIYYPAKPTLQLFGDKSKLKQVMVNLIQNAVKYTEKGKVEVLVQEESDFGRIIIRDTGIGISPEDVGRIFERFYRVDKARSRAVGGTGLGLAIVKHIVEAHSSKIEVKSESDKGSEFSFKLKK
jgi:two-component system, OmpR family, phosphate regulon sensor histidine kinase PhoR